MSANKRKLLESARKLAQKGAKDKALAEYQKLLRLDPKDAKLRLEIGDTYRRWGQVEPAVETYTRVAEQYMGEGFDARAVAVFKQILNLDPDRFEAYTPLAELYERMGLTAEAIAALQTAADGLHRQGKRSEALDVLRRMANADPANTTSRIKVADLLRQEGKKEDAVAEYRLAAEELERQGDVETVGNLYRRMLEIDETNVFALGSLARTLSARGKVSEAIPIAERALQLDDGNAERFELLADLFERCSRPADRDKVLRSLAELYRARGDDDRSRDIMQRFGPNIDLSRAEGDELSGAGILDDGADGFFGDEFPEGAGEPEFSVDFGNEAPLDAGSSASGSPVQPLEPVPGSPEDSDPELLFEDEQVPAPPGRRPAAAPARAAEPALDAEQLLAEASVYLRYGKREKAIVHLERVVAAAPQHRGALEKLGEAFAEDGAHERAVEVWLRAAQCADDEGDHEALRVLRARIAVLDEDAAANLGPPPDAAPSTVAPAAAPVPPPMEIDLGAVDDDDELLLEDDFLDEIAGSGAGAGDSSPSLADTGGVDLDLETETQPELGDAEPESGSAAVVTAADLRNQSRSDASLSASARQQVLDDLEEADFYMQQGLHDEAEGIYQRVLAVAPNHPRALLRLGEITAARGGAPAAVASVADADETPVPDIDLDREDDLLASAADDTPQPIAAASEEFEVSVDLDDEELDAGASEPVAAGGLEDLSDLGLDDETERGEPDEGDGDTEEETIDGSDTQELRQREATGRAGRPEPAPAAVAAAPPLAGDGDFDLAAALADAFDDENGASGPLSGGGDDGFDAVFAAFKKGVRETLGAGDHQAHYDLAIAYKEMGLLDDAINELRTAMADPGRTAECLHLIGLCAIDGDQAPLAIEHLEQLMMLPNLDPDALLAARFDLGRALERVGDVDGARREWEAVAAKRPGFQDVSARLAGLGEPKPTPGGGGGFESFDDVMAEVGDEEPASEPEWVVGGESFDDLVAEANSGDERHARPEPDPEPEPPAPARPAARPVPPPRAKKKKISFF